MEVDGGTCEENDFRASIVEISGGAHGVVGMVILAEDEGRNVGFLSVVEFRDGVLSRQRSYHTRGRRQAGFVTESVALNRATWKQQRQMPHSFLPTANKKVESTKKNQCVTLDFLFSTEKPSCCVEDGFCRRWHGRLMMVVAAPARVVLRSDACARRRSIRGHSGAGCITGSMYGVVGLISSWM
ncbi:hypothetical protein LR48_Vigan10g016800 [Vigna angularis]|uniref:Uncharacterized protein n=1 Tax=Phaseolus angularis TaxID=3914 RepID=A0A0L9VGV4_PHAAN|nr:hypothetical protein LR48_Vigan10g016800 [Vigna angularis]